MAGGPKGAIASPAISTGTVCVAPNAAKPVPSFRFLRTIFPTKTLIAAALAPALVLQGCSTVILDRQSGAASGPTVERQSLVAAANEIARSDWPKPETASWSDRFGALFAESGRTTQSQAVGAYLEALAQNADRQGALFAHAERHLAAARALAAAAETVAWSPRPTKSDVAIVEAAIGELRDIRDVYLAALRAIAKDGETVDSRAVQALRNDFRAAIAEMGAAADAIADAVASDRSKTFAEPAARFPFAGSY